MTRLAYLDVVAGAAGDMIMAACVDAGRRAGLPVEEAVTTSISSLGLECAVSFDDADRGGLRCLVASVAVPEDRFAPDQLHAAIDRAEAPDHVRETASRGLRLLVRAEAQVHGIPVSQVHLHELGSADTAADLIGCAAALDALHAGTIHASPVPVPHGTTSGEHGAIPLPAPATLALLKGAPLFGVDDTFERVTPTGAAVLAASRASFGPMPPMTLEEVGIGGGRRDRPHPNVVRLLLGSAADTRTAAAGTATAPDAAPASPIPSGLTLAHDVLLETNIDDQTPELIGDALQALMDAGAKDVWVTPILMKKSRPAFMLSALADPHVEGRVLDALFRHTTTLGARRREVAKWVVDREELHVPVRGTNVRVKVGRLAGQPVTVSPEYEDCAHVARRLGIPVGEVYREAAAKAHRVLAG